jgi:predicted dehydrogenase
MRRINRRQFLRQTAGVSLGTLALSAGTRSVRGANDRVNLALIGCGGRGHMLARGFIECGARISHLCDLHDERRQALANELEQVQGSAPVQERLMRRILDTKGIDAVVIALPDHWHAPASILACQAGKDVYVEKPPAHNVWEAKKMIEAARKYERILQVGTQNRSGPYNHAARAYIKDGKLGAIHLVKVFNLKSGGPFRLGAPGTPPAGFDWDAWLGPAPQRPYHQNIFQGGWHKFWDFSGGDLADDGIHQLDLALMVMGEPGLPKTVSSSGGHLAFPDDDSEVPDVQVVAYEFDKFVMTFELSEYPRYMEKTTATIRRNDLFPYWTQNSTRIELYGSERMMTLGRHGGGWVVQGSGGRVADQMYGRPPDQNHETNFLECIKSRRRPNADIETLYHTTVMVHMANIACCRVGNRKLRFDGATQRFIDSPDANELLKRQYRPNYAIPEQV